MATIGVASDDPTLQSATIVSNAIIGAATTAVVGFYGAAVTARPAATNQAAPSATLTVSGAVTSYGFTTSTQADALVNCVISIRQALVSLGLIKGSN